MIEGTITIMIMPSTAKGEPDETQRRGHPGAL